eukprot:scaffold10270_cov417-Chaetoceros_neogracile.AAC.19
MDHDAKSFGLTSSDNSDSGGDGSEIVGLIQMSQLNEKWAPSNHSTKDKSAQREITKRVIVPEILRPTGGNISANMKLKNSRLYEEDHVKGGASVRLFPSQIPEMFPFSPALGVPNTAGAPRLKARMLPMHHDIVKDRFACSVARNLAPFATNAALSTDIDANIKEMKRGSGLDIRGESVIVVQKATPIKDPISNRKDPSAFVEGSVEHFWECKHCSLLPFHWRATGSVVFCAEIPTIELVGRHLSVCQGKKPLLIPRNARIIQVKNSSSVLVKWNRDESKCKANRTKRKSLGPGESANKKRKTVAGIPIGNIKHGVDDALLAVQEDKSLTTDFAFFTVLQLKRCYLTKSGGSRGNCPLGYPGLACRHCAGYSNERRFFYTSADHLRNSFSHIPSHILSCVHAPPDVKANIEEKKEQRNKQKTQLKAGSHKRFIDLVWTKLHGEGGGAVLSPEEKIVSLDASDDDKSITSLSVDFEFNPKEDYLHKSLDGQFLESKEISIETTRSALLSPQDRNLTTNYVFFSLLQQMPKTYMIDSKGDLAEIGSEKKAIEDGDEAEEASPQRKIKMQVNSIFAKPGVSIENGLTLPNTETENIQESENEPKDKKNPNIFHTLVCKHCRNEDMQVTFLPESAEDLSASFSDIPAHLMSCSKCPQSVKTKLETLKAFRPIQEAMLKRGTQKELMSTVWNRVESHSESKEDDGNALELKDLIIPDYHNSEVLSPGLVVEGDRLLVTAFTFYTFQQLALCVLDDSGNGSRSMFTFGFPGLGCKYCAHTLNARKFFYRTVEILSGNYAHIPNHILMCAHTPVDVKRTLIALKKTHPGSKQKLSRGSQRTFFERIFSRIHSKKSEGGEL